MLPCLTYTVVIITTHTNHDRTMMGVLAYDTDTTTI